MPYFGRMPFVSSPIYKGAILWLLDCSALRSVAALKGDTPTMLQLQFRLNFATRHDAEAGVYVGYCPALKLYSQGTTQEEAEKAVVSAAQLFIVTCYEKDILHSALRKRGMVKAAAASMRALENGDKEFISVKNFDHEFWRDVPINLLAAQEAAVPCLQ